MFRARTWEPPIKSLDKLRTNGQLLIPFVVSQSNRTQIRLDQRIPKHERFAKLYAAIYCGKFAAQPYDLAHNGTMDITNGVANGVTYGVTYAASQLVLNLTDPQLDKRLQEGGRMSTRRMAVFVVGLILAATPLTWFSIDPNAGNTLLKWTSKSPANSSLAANLR